MFLRPALVFAVFGIVMPAPSAAQIVDTTTGSIIGAVRDGTGAVLPAVQVRAAGDALMVPRVTVTGITGEYRLAGLPPGEYVLSFALPGFTLGESSLQVMIGRTSTVDVTLAVASRQEAVTVVTRADVLDPHTVTLGDTFDARQLAHLPTSRSMAGLFGLTHAFFVPALEVGGGDGILSGSYGAYGRNASPRHMVEGIVVTGMFGAGFTPDYGSILEGAVLTGAHTAEWPTAGIHTQFVTKSGGNRYAGAFYGAYEHRRWQSVNVDAVQIARVASSENGASARHVNRIWRNHDLNGDIGGFVVKDRLWWYGSVRTHEIAARLVNFPAQPYVTKQANYSGKASYMVAPGHTLVAYGQGGRNHQPHRLDPFGRAGGGLAADTAINERADWTANQRNLAWLWKGEWDGVVTESLLFDIRAGQFAWEQDWQSRSSLPRFEDVDTLLVNGGNRDWHSTGRRNQLLGTASYFTEGRFGTHHLKFGGEGIRFLVTETWRSAYPGNVVHILRSGVPTSVFIFDAPSQSKNGVLSYAAFASDSWRLGTRLTLSLGMRFDRYRLFLPAQEHASTSSAARQFPAVDNLRSWNTIVPRLAAAYDPAGDRRILVKVAFDRYRLAPNASVAANANPNSGEWWVRYDWSDPNRSGTWDDGEQGRETSRRGGFAIERIDPNLQLPVVNEVGAWVERELPSRIGVRSGVLWRGEHTQLARQNIFQPFDAFTVRKTVTDPGPDGIAGTGDDGTSVTVHDLPPSSIRQTVNILSNVPRSASHYWTLELAATRRRQDRWSLGAGFTHTWNREHAAGYSGQGLRNNVYALTPNDLINAGPDGRYEFTTWTAKAHGTYELPRSFSVTPVLRHQSGQPFGRTFTTDRQTIQYATVTVLAEPVGSRRMDNITLLDLRVDKRLRLRGDRRLGAFIDVFNLFNTNAERNVVWSSGASFLRPVSIVPPRVARVGMSLDW
jgi:hypothetical protein